MRIVKKRCGSSSYDLKTRCPSWVHLHSSKHIVRIYVYKHIYTFSSINPIFIAEFNNSLSGPNVCNWINEDEHITQEIKIEL